jgi:hypothetical protein
MEKPQEPPLKIAENLEITQEQMKLRFYMDIRRW